MRVIDGFNFIEEKMSSDFLNLLACRTQGKMCVLIHFRRGKPEKVKLFGLSLLLCYFSQESTDFSTTVCKNFWKKGNYLQSNGTSKFENQMLLQMCYLALPFAVLQKFFPVFEREKLLLVKVSFIIILSLK